MAEFKSQKQMDWEGYHLSPLIWYNQLQYHVWVDTDIIFKYQELFFGIINSSEITSEATI